MNRKITLLLHTHVFAKEANPHWRARTAHVHSEDGLQEGISYTCQVHFIILALL